jgi:hypothetical protein
MVSGEHIVTPKPWKKHRLAAQVHGMEATRTLHGALCVNVPNPNSHPPRNRETPG